MKKFLATLLVVCSLFFASTANAEIKTYTGEGSATMSENENQEQVINRAKTYAIRNASEQAGVHVISQSKMRDLELVDDEVISITGGLMKITDIKVVKSWFGGGVLQVRVTVTVQIDTEALQREIERRLEKQRPKTPIDRPKPIEPPTPKPVEQPKPTTPIDKPKPIENPAPTVSQDTIKTYVGTDDYTVGQRETQEDAQENSKLRALRNAQEQAGFYLRSQSRSKDLELVDDEIITVAASIMKIIGTPDYKTEVLNDGRSILLHTKVTVQIDIADLERRLEELARRKKH